MARSKRKISQNTRLKLIRDKLLNNGEVHKDKLAKKFKVSGMTIHRDLERTVTDKIIDVAGEKYVF